ncbi:acetyl-CoA carboxylase biotin carboxyl carrier protein [Seleniivibrio sp.]|uniref:acetyl-CoA carboxylase biotin carboxyl carrier protein n=1 Tax=Seleniivibrio sp. TaxID=2898801 RepID=UPI0025D72459|nr:acetyl-CoA carboxylase biotin carboxyl carrier protein [Seleniivibrio sp.]MCD8554066.1 acetyl-CoA carboxylase biotin carboxyl carrier protein [Seleniivibrio sp.]
MDIKEIKELIRFIEKSDIKEFEYENEKESIYISKTGDAPQIIQGMPQMQYAAPAPLAAAPAPAAAVAAAPAAAPAVAGTEVKSPIVGTLYEAPAPGAAPFVSEGDTVRAGQTLCIVEAMKIMNEIEAEFDCVIKKRVVMNGKPVEYGETIFIVEPI